LAEQAWRQARPEAKGGEMADRVLFISWGQNIAGREEHGLEVFNEALGLYGRMQQDGRIESFDVVLLEPNGDLGGYIELHGSHEQLSAIQDAEDYRRVLYDASLVVKNLRGVEGFANEAISREMSMYQEAISRVPQTA
jgi:hypothetical protein